MKVGTEEGTEIYKTCPLLIKNFSLHRNRRGERRPAMVIKCERKLEERRESKKKVQQKGQAKARGKVKRKPTAPVAKTGNPQSSTQQQSGKLRPEPNKNVR